MPSLKLLTVCATAADGSKPFLAAFRRVLDTPLHAKTAYWLGKIYRTCLSEAEAFDAVRNKRVIELGMPVEGKPGKFQIPNDKMQAFIEELTAMERDIDLAVPAGLKLKLPEEYTPADWEPLLSKLENLFEEPL